MKTVSIVIPIYNEEQRLRATLDALVAYVQSQHELEIRTTLVNDGSQDNSLQVLNEYAKKYNWMQIVNYTPNHGKGEALKRGILAAAMSDFYYLADADLSASWNVLTELIANIGDANAIIGSRASAHSHVSTSWYRFLLGRLSAWLIQIVLGLGIKDTQCGYKLFDSDLRQLVQLVTHQRWSFDFELLYIYKLAGRTVKEYGIAWENKTGSKVKFFDYFKQLPALVKIRLTHNAQEVKNFLG